MKELLLALLFVLLYAGLLTGFLVYVHKRTNYFDRVAKRRAEVKASPYKEIDYQMMVDAGMTVEQIEKAIHNSMKEI